MPSPIASASEERTPDGPADEGGRPSLVPHLRSLLAAGLASSAAAMLVGGIFGSWAARLLCLFATAVGVAWAALALRSRRPALVQAGLLPAAFVLGILSLIPAGDGGPSALPRLVREAVRSGRLLRPPVPFDPGWRPVLLVLMAVLAFASAWLATALARPKWAIAVTLPIIGLTAISQPSDGEVLAGVAALVGVLGALAVLFGGDAGAASELGSQFEIRRAIRGAAIALPLLIAIVVLSNASFLFPSPVYNPADKPQKPKPVPLSAAEDRVLFEIQTASEITGPWRVGVLDVYDGTSWRLPPFDPDRFVPIPADGRVPRASRRPAAATVRFTLRDLGDSSALPGLANMGQADSEGADLVFDPRSEILRVPKGRAPAGLAYTVHVPAYPTPAQLEAARPADRSEFEETLEVPKPPGAVADLLEGAPTNKWKRLDHLRKALNDKIVAAGAGAPIDVPPARVATMLTSAPESTPFEIVAAEALLARWAGVPSRIGFGFDGLNDENGVFTVRPKNAAQFLEVWFEGYGWVPLSQNPPKAKAKLDTDPNARFNPSIRPSDEVAVEIYLPFELESLRLLYQQVREWLVRLLPFVLATVAAWVTWPAARKALRRRRRRRWAAGQGRAAQIAVEYAELRDATTDLNLGDPYDTPLEFLSKIADDDEHAQLAWLVTRVLYGDLAETVTDADVRASEDMSASLRRRLWRAQPYQSRVIGALARTSLRHPYTREIP